MIVLSAAPTPAASRTIAFVLAKYQSYDIFHRPANPVVLFLFSKGKKDSFSHRHLDFLY